MTAVHQRLRRRRHIQRRLYAPSRPIYTAGASFASLVVSFIVLSSVFFGAAAEQFFTIRRLYSTASLSGDAESRLIQPSPAVEPMLYVTLSHCERLNGLAAYADDCNRSILADTKLCSRLQCLRC